MVNIPPPYTPFHNNRILLTFKKCFTCDNVNFETKDDYHEHMANIHDLNAMCDLCGKRFKDQNLVRNHKLRVHKIKIQFQCVVCDYTMPSARQLETHYTEKHGPLDPKMNCYTQIEVKVTEPVVKKEVIEIITEEKKVEDVKNKQ